QEEEYSGGGQGG
nr:Chain B, Protein AMBP [Homo sapiens]